MLDMLCTKINSQNLYIVIPPLTDDPSKAPITTNLED